MVNYKYVNTMKIKTDRLIIADVTIWSIKKKIIPICLHIVSYVK